MKKRAFLVIAFALAACGRTEESEAGKDVAVAASQEPTLSNSTAAPQSQPTLAAAQPSVSAVDRNLPAAKKPDPITVDEKTLAMLEDGELVMETNSKGETVIRPADQLTAKVVCRNYPNIAKYIVFFQIPGSYYKTGVSCTKGQSSDEMLDNVNRERPDLLGKVCNDQIWARSSICQR